MPDDLDAWLAGTDDEPDAAGVLTDPGPASPDRDPPDPFGRVPRGSRSRWDEPSMPRSRVRLVLVAGLPWLVVVALLAARLGGGTQAATPASPIPSATAMPLPTPTAIATAPPVAPTAPVMPADVAAAATPTFPPDAAEQQARTLLATAAAVTAVRTGVSTDAGAGRHRFVDHTAVESLTWRGDVAIARVLAVVLEGHDAQLTDTALRHYAVALRLRPTPVTASGPPDGSDSTESPVTTAGAGAGGVDAGSAATRWSVEVLAGPWAVGGEPVTVGQAGFTYATPADAGEIVAALEVAGWAQVVVRSVGQDQAIPGVVAVVLDGVAPGDTLVAPATVWLGDTGSGLAVLGT